MDEATKAITESLAGNMLICKAIVSAVARQPGVDRAQLEVDLRNALLSLDSQVNSELIQSMVLAFANDLPRLIPRD
jgi:hypothetical protein